MISVPLILPLPEVAMVPVIPGLSLVQLYTVPAIALPDKVIWAIREPEHIICEGGVAVAVCGAGQPITRLYVGPFPVQVFASDAVTTMGKVPACVGMPLNTPAADKVKPVGKVLAVVKL